MPSKMSYFNKTIFYKNITRFWPIWSVYLLICLVTLPLRIYTDLSGNSFFDNLTDMYPLQSRQLIAIVESSTNPSIVFIFAFISGVAVFSYLYTTSSAYLIHSLPIRRESIFITNYLSGLSFMIIPLLVTFLTSILVCFAMHVTLLIYLLQWLIHMSGMVFFAFSLAVFTSLLTGHIAATPAFYLLFNFIYIGFRSTINTITGTIVYGFEGKEMIQGCTFLSPWYFLHEKYQSMDNILERAPDMLNSIQLDLLCLASYSLVGILLFMISMNIFIKRPIEVAGDLISISFLKPILRWTAAICTGSTLSAFILSNFFPINRILSNHFLFILVVTLFGGIIAFFFWEMLMEKSIVVFSKKRLAECGIFTAVVALLLLMLELDVFGFESRLPQVADIESIYFTGAFPFDAENTDFSEIRSIHSQVIDSKKEFEHYSATNKNDTSSILSFDYKLKNGTNLTRNYKIPVDDYFLTQKNSVIKRVLTLSHNPNYYIQFHFTDRYQDLIFTDATIYYFSNAALTSHTTDASITSSLSSNSLETLSPAQTDRVFEAFLKDIMEGNYYICNYNNTHCCSDKIYYNNITMMFYAPNGSAYPDHFGIEKVSADTDQNNTTINLTTDCTNTLSVLKELGFTDDTHKFLTRKEYRLIMKKLNKP